MKLCHRHAYHTSRVTSVEVTEAEIARLHQGTVNRLSKLRTKSVPKLAPTLRCCGAFNRKSHNQWESH